MLAGYETTAVALATCIYMLARHPAAEQQLLQELEGTKIRQPIRYEDLASFPFASAVLKETLRLQGPAALFARVATKDTHVREYVYVAHERLPVDCKQLPRAQDSNFPHLALPCCI